MPPRVLLVEDDLVTASALIAILTRRGFDVLLATTVAQGMAMLAREPAYVVLDLMLPDGDGSALLRYVRDQHLPARVLVTTAVSDPARLSEVRRLTPDVLMQKPIDLHDLLKLIVHPN
jgi:two-component system response regulator RegA